MFGNVLAKQYSTTYATKKRVSAGVPRSINALLLSCGAMLGGVMPADISEISSLQQKKVPTVVMLIANDLLCSKKSIYESGVRMIPGISLALITRLFYKP